MTDRETIKPQIDILLATYNGSRYLEEQIESIINQTYSNWRLLVSDDCSTDSTRAILRRFEEEDPRIKVVSDSTKFGTMLNFMHLLKCSDAPYFMFCDQDDLWLEGKVEQTFAGMQKLESETSDIIPLLVFTDSAVVDENLNTLCGSFVEFSGLNPLCIEPIQLVMRNEVSGCVTLGNAALREKALSVDALLAAPFEYHDYWVAVAASCFGKISYIDKATMLYRQHGKNVLGAKHKATIAPTSNRYLSEFLESARYRIECAQNRACCVEEAFGKELEPRLRNSLRALMQLPKVSFPRRLFLCVRHRLMFPGNFATRLRWVFAILVGRAAKDV